MKVKKFFFSFFCLGLFLTPLASPAQAVKEKIATDSSVSLVSSHQEKLEEIRQRFQEKKENLRFKIEEHRATRAARLAEARKLRIRNSFERLADRFEQAIDRLERLISRIKSRLAKIEESNEAIKTSSIREKITEAEEKLAEANAALTQAKTGLEDVLSSQDPKESFVYLKDLVRAIKRQLVEVHQTLVYTIGEIKGLRVGQNE